MDPRLPRWFFVIFAAYGILQFWHDYSHLPNIVAGHFNAAGTPNGWEMKQSLGAVYAVVMLLCAGLVFVIPEVIARAPSINLPNRDYWLAPERREASIRFLGASFGWFGCATLVLMVLVFRFVEEFNLRPANPPNPAQLWYFLAGYGAFMVIWTAVLLVRFSGVPADGR